MDRLEVTYTDENRVEIGMIDSFSLDLAYGNDENDFELTVPIDTFIPKKSLVYIDGTEWGGVVRGCRPSTLGEAPTNTVTGQTWHGVLAESCVCPDAGKDYYVSEGEANAAMGALLARQGLDDLFDASSDDSGFDVDHQHARYENVYLGIRKMLRNSGAKLRIVKEPGRKPMLSAVEVGSYIDDGSSERFAYELTDGTPYNHIICLGMGDLAERNVVHLYADADGNVSSTQTLFGLDERQYVYELSNEDTDALVEDGTKKLKEMQNVSMCELRLSDDSSFDVGDVVGVIDDDTGVSVVSDVTKVIVKIGVGAPEISNEIGDISVHRTSDGYYEGGSAGIVYKAGVGIEIAGATISADVTLDKLAKKSDANHRHDASHITTGTLPVGRGGTGGASAASARTNIGAMGAVSTGTYFGMARPDGNAGASDWIRTTQAGIIPYQSGYSSSLGTSTWQFLAIYGKTISEDNVPLATKYAAKSHAHAAADVTSGTFPLARGGTGATTAQGACDSLATASLGAKRVIPANANINAYVAPGSYTCNADVTAKTLVNCPTGGRSFHLLVDRVLGNATYLAQTIVQYNDSVVWMRVSINAGAAWSAWKRIWAVAETAAAALASLGLTATAAELNYMDGVTSPVQTQLNAKAASSHTHNVATASTSGYMSSSDKQLMDTLRTGAVTGVKGNSETAYRTGNVNLTAANLGALPLAGGTMDATAQVKRVGRSMSWITGRDGAPFRQTSYTGYNPMWSAKTPNGSWEMGPYTNNNLYFNYVTDANYNAGTNSPTAQIAFGPDGSLSVLGLTVAGKTLLDRTYPVGAVYTSYVSTSPASLFGGTWTAITGRFPYFNAGTGTGGANTHTLTTAQMPSHRHGVYKRDGQYLGHTGVWSFDTQDEYFSAWGGSGWSESVGGGGSHNNMPAYQTLYAWRRTA